MLANFVDQTRKEICAQAMSSSLDARSPLFAWGYVKEVVVVISKRGKILKLQECTICTFNNKNRYITVTWVNSECLVWSQKKCEKSRLSMESTVDSIPPMETTSFPYRANVREKKNNHVPLEGARPKGQEKRLTVNDLINAHSQINASYLIKAPLCTLSSLY